MKNAILCALTGPPPPWVAEEPIRSELFSIERLEQHGESLAAAQRVLPRLGTGRRLAARLRDNERVLHEAYRSIIAAIQDERAITPAAEWLADNFHVVQEQISEIRDELPPGYYRQLPKLAEGPLRDFPRVFGLAWAFVAHTDSRFDPQVLSRFVHAYQRVQPLTVGELWALAITLRIVLVENLRRLAEASAKRRAARQEADILADRLLGLGAGEGEPAEIRLERVGRAALPPAFAVQLVQRLRDQDPRVMPVLVWLDERLAAQGTTADALVREEHQRQGATNVTVGNVITSMRLISAVDWADFFESVSLVDDVLRTGSAFADMDFPSRDRYRHAIEELARGSRLPEIDVARRAIRAAGRAGGDAACRARDPGYHLLSRGRPAFEADLGFRPPLKARLVRVNAALGISGYLGAIAICAAAFIALALFAMAGSGVGGWPLAILALLALMPAVDAAVALVKGPRAGSAR